MKASAASSEVSIFFIWIPDRVRDDASPPVRSETCSFEGGIKPMLRNKIQPDDVPE